MYLLLTWSMQLPAGSILSKKLCFTCGECQTMNVAS